MKKKVYIYIMLILSTVFVIWYFYGNRISIGRAIKKRRQGMEGNYSKVIIDKTSSGDVVLITEDDKIVDKIMNYIIPFTVEVSDENILLGEDTYTMNFYGDSLDDGMTITINNGNLVEIYTIYKNKTEIKTYKIIGNVLRINDILEKAKSS
ncbi:hypothetical protein SAMN02745248_00513 [Hathewaya proteolytica DSM 3090]|uniref:Uncharacterized protein n=1 Tax=Hathewaya proteolytica DSM 3090 TaxID=1121331 RepID=A0A1M6KLL1_9CLOT|nr:hypothetical protein [Hathewaya proteolytica]SHJ59791.1 hypothetical protein SAMN02745248_00513 [Hathewaya proteolytica DSM 3090]